MTFRGYCRVSWPRSCGWDSRSAPWDCPEYSRSSTGRCPWPRSRTGPSVRCARTHRTNRRSRRRTATWCSTTWITTGGTSGSAIFDHRGFIIAVNFAGYGMRIVVPDPDGEPDGMEVREVLHSDESRRGHSRRRGVGHGRHDRRLDAAVAAADTSGKGLPARLLPEPSPRTGTARTGRIDATSSAKQRRPEAIAPAPQPHSPSSQPIRARKFLSLSDVTLNGAPRYHRTAALCVCIGLRRQQALPVRPAGSRAKPDSRSASRSVSCRSAGRIGVTVAAGRRMAMTHPLPITPGLPACPTSAPPGRGSDRSAGAPVTIPERRRCQTACFRGYRPCRGGPARGRSARKAVDSPRRHLPWPRRHGLNM